MNTIFPSGSDAAVPTIEEHIKLADELAQAVLNAWGFNAIMGNTADFTAEFKVLANKASAYKTAEHVADGARKAKALAGKMHSQQNVDFSQLDRLNEQALADENAARESFARACKQFSEENDSALVETQAA
jgi:HD-like signal output (HDOD) protein